MKEILHGTDIEKYLLITATIITTFTDSKTQNFLFGIKIYFIIHDISLFIDSGFWGAFGTGNNMSQIR